MSVDFGMAYLDGEEVDVSESLTSHDDPMRWQGTSEGDAFIAFAQFNMQF